MAQFGLKPLPPHTAAKHQLLRRYLGAWFPIMSKWNGRLIYFDAFSGPGRYEGGEPGSPLIALDTLTKHSAASAMDKTEFVALLNEADSVCSSHLASELDLIQSQSSAWPQNIHVHLRNESFVDLATSLLDDLEKAGASLAPTFAFIDPVGVKSTPMSVLAKLAKFPKVEMLVYFATEATVRHATSGQIDHAFHELFGCDAFKAPVGDREQFYVELYGQKLHKQCGYKYVQNFAMYDHRGKRLYDLFYCTNEILGLKRMKEAMWKMDPVGSFRFHDRLAGMDVLFAPEVDLTPLRKALTTQFNGQTAQIDQIVDFVVTSTPYLETHVKTKTLKPMQAEGLISCTNQRRPGTFPTGTLVTFASV